MRFNAEHVPDLLGPDGPMARLVQPYEDRPYQREMALEVARVLEEGGYLAVEAPTGIGKSLAYGLPAALWAAAGNGPVVISTFTKALQEQWLRVEGPRLRELVDAELRVEVLKGRNNYLCRRRYDIECRQAGGERTRALLERLRPWVDGTTTGDLAECGETHPKDLRYLYLKVSSDPQFCGHRDCSPASGCFFKQARQRAQDADLLIVNHALLAIHLFEEQVVLPSFDALIVDEAHAFVTASLDHMTRAAGPGRFAQLEERAAIGYLPPWLMSGDGDTRFAALRAALGAAVQAGGEVFGKTNGRRPGGDQRQRYRDPAELDALCPEGFARVDEALSRLAGETASLDRFIASSVDESDQDHAWFTTQIARFRDELASVRRDLDDLLHPDPNDGGVVFWKEWSGEDAFSLCTSPLEIGPRLVPSLEQGPTRLVFTSATLAAGEDFGFFARETGLDGRLHALALPSPFDYPAQVLGLAVRGGPDPRADHHAQGTAETLHALMTDPGRKAMALFTSYRDLRGVGEALSSLRSERAYSVFAQGEGRSPAELLDAFRRTERGLLLGTASFWQGIDLPGEDLEVLVMTRLPFGVPTDPRFMARSELVEQRGGNAFMDLYLPEAILRFKQGFGRLIRRRSDRGVLAVLDPRLLNKSYGRRFARALPVPLEPVDAGAELARRTADWWRSAPEADAVMPSKGD